MNLTAIVAMTEAGVIGRDNALPWPRLPKDLARFQKATMGCPLIVGRRTFEGLPATVRERLPIVVSGTAAVYPHGLPARTLADALSMADFQAHLRALRGRHALASVVVLGGASVYSGLMPQCNRILLTVVHGDFPGDVVWPGLLPWNDPAWRLALPMIPVDDGDAGDIPVTFAEYERIKP